MSRTSACQTDRHSRRRGAAVLEMTVAMSMLLSLMLGGIEFGYYIYAKNLIESA